MERVKRSDERRATHRDRLSNDQFSTFAGEDANDDKILKSTIWIAIGCHAVLLLINFPNFTSPEAIEPEVKKVFVLKQHRFKQRVEPPTRIPPKKVRKVPVPDPNPDQLEPIRIDQPEPQIDLPIFDGDFLDIPDAPPAPPMPDGPVYVAGDIQKPERLHAPQPNYTEVARRARIQGTVIMQAVIDHDGRVTELSLAKGLPMGLSEATLETVKQWTFKPATLRGKPISVYWTLTVHFKLQ